MIERVGRGGDQAARQALGSLLARYLPALRAYLIGKRGIQPHCAEDLLQEFIATKVLEKNLIGRADRALGSKFRTFLLTALDRFVLNKLRDARAAVRFPRTGRVVGLDAAYGVPSRGVSPPEAFEIAWAREVLEEVSRRMKAECMAKGRADIWVVFECRTLRPILDRTEPLDYEEVVKRFGYRSPLQAWNVLMTAKRMYRRLLLEVVAEYAGPEHVEAEVAELREILSRGGAESERGPGTLQ